MVMCLKLLHSANASVPISFISPSKSTYYIEVLSPSQFYIKLSITYLSIDVILFGIFKTPLSMGQLGLLSYILI